MTAKVYCNGTRAKCLRDIELTVNMSGAPIEFEFSKEWDGLTKTAVFTSDGSRSRILDKDGKTTVPHEILTTVGMDVEAAVFAQREDGTTWPSPSLVCKIGQVSRGAKPGEDPSYQLTPDIAQQLQNQIDKLDDKVEDLEQGGTDNGFRVQDTALVATRRKTIPDMDAEEHLGRSLRGIFADSNIVQGGDFESSIPAIGGVEGTMTDSAPSITDGMLALNAGGAGSYISLPAYTFEVGRTYYVAARFKVDEYTQGRMGVQSTQSIYAPKESTLGAWVTVSSYLQRTTEYSGASYIGAMKESGTGGAQPILRGYIDNVCVLDLTAIFGEGAEPGKEKMDELYALYLAALEGRSINGSFTIASLPDAGELPAEECLYRFKRAMNAKATYIGMSGSSFISPSGLALTGTDDPFLQNNYGTAADMMKLGLACFSSEKLMQILRVYSYNGITSLVRGGALESAIAEAQYHYYGGKGGSLTGSASGQEGHGILNFVALCAAGDYNFVVSILGEWLYDEGGSKKFVSPLVVDALEAVYTKLTRGTAVVGEALQAAIDREEYPVSVAACAIPAGSESAWAMYGGASVLDGAVSWSSTPDATHALASVTKLLTALVVLDNVHDLNERVTIKASDNVGGSGTALGEGESCTYNDLLHLMLMESNNCAATALGRAVGERLLRLGVTDAVQSAAENVKVPVVPGGGTSDAVQYIPQTLTEEQQMQARANMGLYHSKETLLDEVELTVASGRAEARVQNLVEGAVRVVLNYDGGLLADMNGTASYIGNPVYDWMFEATNGRYSVRYELGVWEIGGVYEVYDGTYTAQVYAIATEQVPDEYIPDTIARKADIPESGGITEESDPTVQGWAKTAVPAEVGQYFRVSAVDENGNVTAVEAVDAPSGGGETWRLVNTIELTEDAATIEITQDSDGNPFMLKKFLLRGSVYGASSNTNNGYMFAETKSGASGSGARISAIPATVNAAGTRRTFYINGELIGVRLRVIFYSNVDGLSEGNVLSFTSVNGIYPTTQDDGLTFKSIKDFNLYASNSGYGSGTAIELWGVDA